LSIALRTSSSFLSYLSYLADSSLHANFDLAHKSVPGIDSLSKTTQLRVIHQLPKQYLTQTSCLGLNAPDKWQDRTAINNAWMIEQTSELLLCAVDQNIEFNCLARACRQAPYTGGARHQDGVGTSPSSCRLHQTLHAGLDFRPLLYDKST